MSNDDNHGGVLEQCPFCKHPVMPGATVCGTCNAFKDKQLSGIQHAAVVVLGLVALVTGFFGFAGFSVGKEALGFIASLIAFAAIFGIIKICTGLTEKWYHRQ